MKIVNGKIAEATRNEMFDYYLTRDWDTVMPFAEFLRRCEENGTKIIGKKEGGREVNEPPPLGITPRFIIDEQRAREIIFGILRFLDAGRPVPREWLEELFDRVKIKEEGGAK